MKLSQKLLAPTLLLGAAFAGAAMAQEKVTLPEAPSSTYKIIPAPTDHHWTYQDTHPAIEYKVPEPPKDPSAPFGDGFIGRIAGYVDRHSTDSQPPYDFAMSYRLSDRFTFMAGSLGDMRAHSGQYEANRQAMRVMTGMPDWETRNIRDTMSGGMPNRGMRGGDGVVIGLKIQLGGGRR